MQNKQATGRRKGNETNLTVRGRWLLGVLEDVVEDTEDSSLGLGQRILIL